MCCFNKEKTKTEKEAAEKHVGSRERAAEAFAGPLDRRRAESEGLGRSGAGGGRLTEGGQPDSAPDAPSRGHPDRCCPRSHARPLRCSEGRGAGSAFPSRRVYSRPTSAPRFRPDALAPVEDAALRPAGSWEQLTRILLVHYGGRGGGAPRTTMPCAGWNHSRCPGRTHVPAVPPLPPDRRANAVLPTADPGTRLHLTENRGAAAVGLCK